MSQEKETIVTGQTGGITITYTDAPKGSKDYTEWQVANVFDFELRDGCFYMKITTGQGAFLAELITESLELIDAQRACHAVRN